MCFRRWELDTLGKNKHLLWLPYFESTSDRLGIPRKYSRSLPKDKSRIDKQSQDLVKLLPAHGKEPSTIFIIITILILGNGGVRFIHKRISVMLQSLRLQFAIIVDNGMSSISIVP